MILQALYEYYQRKAAVPDSGIAPEGFEWKEIPFVIVIDKDGKFVKLEDTREGNEKKKKAKAFLVPSLGEKRANGIKANLLWDNIEYALGANPRKRNDISLRKNAFIQRLKSTFNEEVSAMLVSPLLTFLENEPERQIINAMLKQSELWQEVYVNNENVLFRIDGSDDSSLCDTLRPYIKKTNERVVCEGICLVSGENRPIAQLHSAIQGVRGAQTAGAALISFNQKPFASYGKIQNYNAPLSDFAAFTYTTALNLLLAKGSKNKVQVGDATTVFWAQKHEQFEEMFAAFFGYAKDDPDADVRAVKALYDGMFTGHSVQDEGTRFYVLGLAPNAARLSVRFWHTGTINEFSGKIRQHFNDLEIVRGPKDSGHYAMFWILSAMSQEGKVDNAPPNLSGQIFQSVITGGSYPVTMIHQTIRRVRATQDVTRLQAGILKGCLNRFSRIHKTKEKEITVALDSTNDNLGYRLGRLFAVLEKIQEEANPGINATIRDRFYGAASSTPVTVFPQLLKLKNHHLAKLENAGRKFNFERLLAEIIDGISPGMSPHLVMEDQARFAIGYYHQRQAMFKKSDKNNEKESKEDNNG